MCGCLCRKQTCTVTVIHYWSDDRQLLNVLAPAVIDPITYSSRIAMCAYPTCLRLGGPRRNVAIRFGVQKREWFGYTMVKNFWRYGYLFWQNSRTWQTDRQISHDGIGRACVASRGNNAKAHVFYNNFGKCISILIIISRLHLLSKSRGS